MNETLPAVKDLLILYRKIKLVKFILKKARYKSEKVQMKMQIEKVLHSERIMCNVQSAHFLLKTFRKIIRTNPGRRMYLGV